MNASSREHAADFFLHLREGNWPQARQALFAFIAGKFTLADLQHLLDHASKEDALLARALPNQPVRLAILGGYTTQPVRLALQASALLLDRRTEIYEANYNAFRMEVLDPASGLYGFKPDIVFIATGIESVERFPMAGDSPEQVQALAEVTLTTWTQHWELLRRQTGAQILQHNFPLEAERTLGRLENRYPWSRSRFLRTLNDGFWKLDDTLIRVVDVADLADRVGHRQWTDPRWRHHSKHGFSPALIAEYTRLITGTLRAVWGATKKCVVTDLDNTLWGGMIGEDGLDGIQLGPDSPVGEAHYAFCDYLKQLSERGILLAANSHNDPAIAERVFSTHPTMPLKRDNFAAFVCNWESKAANLRKIATELNLGLDSLVFLDDEPAICAEVRSLVPEVTVVEMSGDPASFSRRLDALHLFDSTGLTKEDSLRAQSYAALARQREQVPGDLEEFLRGLDLRGSCLHAMPEQLPRIEQLLLKTNQFNLTGKKWDLTQLQKLDGGALCLAVQIQDRYANYGLVSAIIGQGKGPVLEVENWVLSCRVFSKTVEAFILNTLTEWAKARGFTSIQGTFIPSAKNGYARTFLEQLGPLGPPQAGAQRWSSSMGKMMPTYVRTTDAPGDKP